MSGEIVFVFKLVPETPVPILWGILYIIEVRKDQSQLVTFRWGDRQCMASNSTRLFNFDIFYTDIYSFGVIDEKLSLF